MQKFLTVQNCQRIVTAKRKREKEEGNKRGWKGLCYFMHWGQMRKGERGRKGRGGKAGAERLDPSITSRVHTY